MVVARLLEEEVVPTVVLTGWPAALVMTVATVPLASALMGWEPGDSRTAAAAGWRGRGGGHGMDARQAE